MEFNKPKHECRLEHWKIQAQLYPVQGYVLTGMVFGHPKCKDGEVVVTSPILSIDFRAKIAETKNSFYKLSTDMCFH